MEDLPEKRGLGVWIEKFIMIRLGLCHLLFRRRKTAFDIHEMYKP